MPFTRRNLLARSMVGCFLLKAGPLARAASGPFAAHPGDPRARAAFPQGVGSADPQPDRILLWTRLHPSQASGASAVLLVQVSPDPGFESVLVERRLPVNKAWDYTLRTIVTGLKPRTDYYYRFLTREGIASRTGRTWTAPGDGDEAPAVIAFASCQSYPPSKYGVYRHLMEGGKSGRGERPDLILHLGDYIYGLAEGVGDRPPGIDERGAPIEDPYLLALESRRRVYRTFLMDDDLQDARALYPFACIWDDHEFSNDAWESYIAGLGSKPQRRLAANQAWFEYVPQILSQSRDLPGAANEAHDFRPALVEDAPMRDFGDGFISLEPHNFSAIQSLRTYRGIRWGRLADILLTDNRIYRGPGANPGYSPESIVDETGSARAFAGFTLFDGQLLNTLALGREANGGNPPAELLIGGEQTPNPRRGAPAVSMLGQRQKDWFKRALKGSDAVWKIWANATPIMGFQFDPGALKPEYGTGYLWTDGWDGFPNERRELMNFLRAERVANVVSLSGDRHAHYAGLVAEDYQAERPRYVIADFVCAAISAFPRGPFLGRHLRRMGLGQLAATEIAGVDGQPKQVSMMEYFMRKGAKAADLLARTGDLERAAAAGFASPNPHLLYADNDVHGYGIARFFRRRMECDFISVAKPEWDRQTFPNGPDALRVVRFRLNRWRGGQAPNLERLPSLGPPPYGDEL